MHVITHTLGRIPLEEGLDLCLTTLNLHGPGGIRTRNPSKQAAADPCLGPMAYPGILFGGGVQQIELRTEDRERGSGGGSPLIRGSGGSCNLVQEISFHIVKFS